MNRHPPSSFGDEPPSYDQETSSFLSEAESPSRQTGPTMRLLPTSGEEYGDLSGSPTAGSPFYQQGYNQVYDQDFDTTP